jgi:hypothetical protein
MIGTAGRRHHVEHAGDESAAGYDSWFGNGRVDSCRAVASTSLAAGREATPEECAPPAHRKPG